MSGAKLSRRGLLSGLVASASAIALSGCDQAGQTPWFRRILEFGEDMNIAVQRYFLSPSSLAKEFAESEISPAFRANGSTDPDEPEYVAHVANAFADYRLEVTGLVETPLSLSLADIRALPARTQITRHDCVEGWSCIGKWTGTPLAHVLERARLKPEARFVVFTCFDQLEKTLDGSGRYYESLGFEDAFHPQTILAYEMNGAVLPVAHGAPLRVRVERQLGYKMAKYLKRIELVSDLSSFGRGRGSFWSDRGYDWYAGI